MKHYNEPPHLSCPAAYALLADQGRLASSAYLARFTGFSRELVPLPPAVDRAIDRATADRAHGPILLDAGVDLRDVQIAARHADPRTTTRCDRARQNLDRHPSYILAAYMASGT